MRMRTNTTATSVRYSACAIIIWAGCNNAAMAEGREFGQEQPPLSVYLKRILERYPGGQIFKVRLDLYLKIYATTNAHQYEPTQATSILSHVQIANTSWLAQLQGDALSPFNWWLYIIAKSMFHNFMHCRTATLC